MLQVCDMNNCLVLVIATTVLILKLFSAALCSSIYWKNIELDPNTFILIPQFGGSFSVLFNPLKT